MSVIDQVYNNFANPNKVKKTPFYSQYVPVLETKKSRDKKFDKVIKDERFKTAAILIGGFVALKFLRIL